MPTIEDRLFEEFLEQFKTIIAEEFPSLDGYEFEESKLRRLFDYFLTFVINVNVGITPTIGQMLAVLKLDPEEEYELQGDEGFQRHLAYPLADAFRWAMEPLRRSEYAKKERSKPKKQRRQRVEDRRRNKMAALPVSLREEIIPALIVEVLPPEKVKLIKKGGKNEVVSQEIESANEEAKKDRVKRAVREDVAFRRGIVQAAAEAYPKARRKNLDELTCLELDERSVDVLEKWKGCGVETWREAYREKELKGRIQKMFSKDRKQGSTRKKRQ